MSGLEKEKKVAAGAEKKEQKHKQTGHASIENSSAYKLSFISKAYMSSALPDVLHPISAAYQSSVLSGWLNPITESQAQIVIEAIKRDLPDKITGVMSPVHQAIDQVDKSSDKKRFTKCLAEIQKHANTVYFSNLIKQCSTKEAIFFRELLTAKRIKFCYLNPYLLAGTRVPGWELAHKIKDEVFSYGLKGTTELKHNKRVPAEQSFISDSVTKIRETAAEKSAGSIAGFHYHQAQLSRHSGFANCEEHGSIVIGRLIAHGFSGNAEIYRIKGAERHVTLGAEVYYPQKETQKETEHDHVFVVLNRDPLSDPHDETTWGPHALIIDTWSGKIYPAYDIYRRLECWYRGEFEVGAINHLEPFDPRAHVIAPLHGQVSLDAIKSWRIEQGIPSEPGEFKNVQAPPLSAETEVISSTAYVPSDAEVLDGIAEIKPPGAGSVQPFQIWKDREGDSGNYSAAQLMASHGLLRRATSMPDLSTSTENSKIKQKPAGSESFST